MAQELRSINLVAPGFKGINTEDSPLAQDPSFAEIADNAVVDRRGRIASRKGYQAVTTDATELGTATIRAIKEFEESDGSTSVFSVGNNKILKGTTTLTDVTPVGYTITDDNWKIVSFNNNVYFFQEGYEPLVYNNAAEGVIPMSTVATGASPLVDIPQGNEVIGAYGRLWTAKKNSSVVYWSDLLIGQNWTEGTSGSIDISKVWPDGYDEIVALATHNNLLIIFGRTSIVVYQGADSPATMTLADTVSGVGCVDRDTVQYTGTDVIFLSSNGLRSFGRTIREKSMPIATLSSNITKDLISVLGREAESFRSVYSPEENFYLLTFVEQQITYCFDLRGTLENGALRVTRWPQSVFTAYERLNDGTLYIGKTNGIFVYRDNTDDGASFRFKYYSPSLDFGDISRLKILKKIRPIIVGGNSASAVMKFAYDFNTAYRSIGFNIESQDGAFFGTNEFGANSVPLSEFTTGATKPNQRSFNASGNGSSVVVGIECDIEGFPVSIQAINLLALLGKTV